MKQPEIYDIFLSRYLRRISNDTLIHTLLWNYELSECKYLMRTDMIVALNEFKAVKAWVNRIGLSGIEKVSGVTFEFCLFSSKIESDFNILNTNISGKSIQGKPSNSEDMVTYVLSCREYFSDFCEYFETLKIMAHLQFEEATVMNPQIAKNQDQKFFFDSFVDGKLKNGCEKYAEI